VVSSVGSERLLHTQEVMGSNPVLPTTDNQYFRFYTIISGLLFSLLFLYIQH
jgi:hypothetical protein